MIFWTVDGLVWSKPANGQRHRGIIFGGNTPRPEQMHIHIFYPAMTWANRIFGENNKAYSLPCSRVFPRMAADTVAEGTTPEGSKRAVMPLHWLAGEPLSARVSNDRLDAWNNDP